MANLKEIRGRITSISSTMQITSAMKMVSAAKLKKAQDAITMLRPYSEKLQEIIENVSSTLEPQDGSVYSEKRSGNKTLYIVVTSNRGLAGAFNSSVLKEVHKIARAGGASEAEFLTIGKKAFDGLKRSYTIYENKSDIFDSLNYSHVANFMTTVMRRFREGNFDKVFVVYNKFINAASQEVTVEQVLPIAMPEKQTKATEVQTDYIFEPGKKEILEHLIPKSIKTQVYKAVLDSIASEHGARMTAMHKATDNANALKNELVITYNKARQAAITNEILEIVGGAEALSNG